MTATWNWLLAGSTGAQLADLSVSTRRTLSARRNTYQEVNIALQHTDEATGILLDSMAQSGMPTLRGYRKGAADSQGILRFNGYLAAVVEEADGDDSWLTATFRDPFARLLGENGERGRFTVSSVTYTGVDAGTIAKTLIDLANVDGPTGIATTGTIQSTVARDRTYEFANVGEAITQLTEVQQGFDFEIKPLSSGSTLGEFWVYSSQGGLKPNAVFEYGEGTVGNVTKFTRQTLPPINVAQMLGANGLFSAKFDQPSIDRFGKFYTLQSQTDVSEQATLDAKAQALLRPSPVRTVAFDADAALAPLPWDDFWLGDTVTLRARVAGRELIPETLLRVNGINVTFDDEGNEAYSLTVEMRDG